MPYFWTLRCPLQERRSAFEELLRELAAESEAELAIGGGPGEDPIYRAWFADNADSDAEERARAFWLELHRRCLDADLLLELAGDGQLRREDWRPFAAGGTGAGPSPLKEPPAPAALSPQSAPAMGSLSRRRAEIPDKPLYEILRADDPEMDRNLEATIQWIEAAGLPVINLLSYLDLPLFRRYAAEHQEEREQSLFLHMLHTWTCYRHFGKVCARVPEVLLETLSHPRYLRLNTTQFRTPAPALCIQLPTWSFSLRAVGGGAMHWVKEIYLTHFEPPTPADDRELTLMLITHDEGGAFGFVPLEIPLSLPAVDQSIAAFFAPSRDDEVLGPNTQDLDRISRLAATYCLYACARDPRRYLTEMAAESMP